MKIFKKFLFISSILFQAFSYSAESAIIVNEYEIEKIDNQLNILLELHHPMSTDNKINVVKMLKFIYLNQHVEDLKLYNLFQHKFFTGSCVKNLIDCIFNVHQLKMAILCNSNLWPYTQDLNFDLLESILLAFLAKQIHDKPSCCGKYIIYKIKNIGFIDDIFIQFKKQYYLKYQKEAPDFVEFK